MHQKANTNRLSTLSAGFTLLAAFSICACGSEDTIDSQEGAASEKKVLSGTFGKGWAKLALAQDLGLGLKSNGKLFSWGSGRRLVVNHGEPSWFETGRLGLGNQIEAQSPTEILPGSKWVDVAASTDVACAIQESGALYCWGANPANALGLTGPEALTPIVATPSQVGSEVDWATVSLSSTQRCGLKTDGTAVCSKLDANAPQDIGSDFVQLDAGVSASCGVNTAGELRCWGSSHSGILGSLPVPGGADIVADSPVTIGTDTDWLRVSVDENLACALKTDASLWCWGSNDYAGLGQPGNQGVKGSPIPLQVQPGTTYQDVLVSGNTHCAVRTDGTRWCADFFAQTLHLIEKFGAVPADVDLFLPFRSPGKNWRTVNGIKKSGYAVVKLTWLTP